MQKSWGAILDELLANGAGTRFTLKVVDDSAVLTSQAMTDEVASLNAIISMDFDFPISIETCGEANAFYSAQTKGITMCSEFEPAMKALVEKM